MLSGYQMFKLSKGWRNTMIRVHMVWGMSNISNRTSTVAYSSSVSSPSEGCESDGTYCQLANNNTPKSRSILMCTKYVETIHCVGLRPFVNHFGLTMIYGSLGEWLYKCDLVYLLCLQWSGSKASQNYGTRTRRAAPLQKIPSEALLGGWC